MKKILIIVILLSITLLAGCTSPSENPPVLKGIPSTQTPDLNLHNVKFTLFNQNHTPVSGASVMAVFDPLKYDRNDSQIFNAPPEQKKTTDENGITGEFVMHGSIEYNLTATLSNGTTYSPWILTPIYHDYNWTLLPTPEPVPTITLTIQSPTTLQDVLNGVNKGVEWFNVIMTKH